MHGHGGQPDARVAFVGDDHDAAAVRAQEIRAGDAGLGLHVLFAQKPAGAAGDGLRVVVVIRRHPFPQKSVGNPAAVLVNDRLDDVRGNVVIELNDEFAEVAFQALDAVFAEEGIEVDFLGGHRLGFGEAGDLMLA